MSIRTLGDLCTNSDMTASTLIEYSGFIIAKLRRKYNSMTKSEVDFLEIVCEWNCLKCKERKHTQCVMLITIESNVFVTNCLSMSFISGTDCEWALLLNEYDQILLMILDKS